MYIHLPRIFCDSESPGFNNAIIAHYPFEKEELYMIIQPPKKSASSSATSDGLMSAADKIKLDSIEEGANKTIVDSALSETSKNPIQNDVTTKALNNKADKSHKHSVSDITDFPESLPASDVSEWAKAATKPAYSATEVGADAAGSAAKALTDAKTYTDGEIANIINGAPTTLDTLGEIADAMEDNTNVVEALDKAIGQKANAEDLTSHTSDISNPHNVTKDQVGLGNVPNVATNDQTPSYTEATSLATLTSGEKLSVAFGKIKLAITNLISHISNKDNPHDVTKDQLGLENVENKSSETIRSEITTDDIVDALGYTPIQTDTTYDVATTSKDGLMSAEDKVKLDETRLWRRAVVGQRTNTVTNPYYKFASTSMASTNSDNIITFKVSADYDSDTCSYLGILTAHVRTFSSGYYGNSTLVWEYASSDIDTSKFILAHNTATFPTVAELWVKIDESYRHYHFDVISEGTRTTSENSLWTLYSKSSEGSESAITSGYVKQTSTVSTLNNDTNGNAATATNAEKVNNCTVESNVPSDAKFTDTTYDEASTSSAGLMSTNDKTKLDNSNIAYGTCNTTSSTSEKIVTIVGNDNWKLEIGSIITVKNSNTNSASNPTLNVNGTGAKSIFYAGAIISSANLSFAGSSNRYERFMYDGERYVWIGHSVDNNTNTTYTNASLGQGYGTCSTEESTIAKAVSLSGYYLITGGIIAVKFTYAVPDAATMNINGKGAKSIYYRGEIITAGKINAGDIATFIYTGSAYYLLSVDRVETAEYDTMTGASTDTDGVAGMVPAPLAGDQEKFLCGDGTWKEVEAVGGSNEDCLPLTGGEVTGNVQQSGATTDYTTYKFRNIGFGTSSTPTSNATYGGSGSIYFMYS